jgi:hypothetical protein
MIVHISLRPIDLAKSTGISVQPRIREHARRLCAYLPALLLFSYRLSLRIPWDGQLQALVAGNVVLPEKGTTLSCHRADGYAGYAAVQLSERVERWYEQCEPVEVVIQGSWEVLDPVG